MNKGNWQEAYRLARYEIRESLRLLKGTGVILLLLLLLFILKGSIIDLHTKSKLLFLYDVLFLAIFGVVWTRPSEFILKSKKETLLSPTVVALFQLPVRAATIIKRQYILMLFYKLLFQVPLLCILYFTCTSIREAMPGSIYLAFSICWISFSIVSGGLNIIEDFGERITLAGKIWRMLIFICFIVLYSMLQMKTGSGIVYTSITLVQNWPLLTSLLFSLIAASSLYIWHYYHLRNMRNLDYL